MILLVTDDRGRWANLTALLATMPDLSAKLAAEHVDDGTGRCRSCTAPGRGVPGARWPCVLALLAVDARRIAGRRG